MCPDPRVIAHEIGHALGLEHPSVDGNLMSTSRRGTDVTFQQQSDLLDGADLLGACVD